MKKLFILSVSLAFCIFCLSGCGGKTEKSNFFTQQKLDECLIPELPDIQSETSDELKDRSYHYSLTEEEFTEYVESVYEYLTERSFGFFGYPKNIIPVAYDEKPRFSVGSGKVLDEFQTDIAFLLDGFSKPPLGGLHYFFVWGNGKEAADEPAGYMRLKDANYLQIGFYQVNALGWNTYLILSDTEAGYSFYMPN